MKDRKTERCICVKAVEACVYARPSTSARIVAKVGIDTAVLCVPHDREFFKVRAAGNEKPGAGLTYGYMLQKCFTDYSEG